MNCDKMTHKKVHEVIPDVERPWAKIEMEKKEYVATHDHVDILKERCLRKWGIEPIYENDKQLNEKWITTIILPDGEKIAGDEGNNNYCDYSCARKVLLKFDLIPQEWIGSLERSKKKADELSALVKKLTHDDEKEKILAETYLKEYCLFVWNESYTVRPTNCHVNNFYVLPVGDVYGFSALHALRCIMSDNVNGTHLHIKATLAILEQREVEKQPHNAILQTTRHLLCAEYLCVATIGQYHETYAFAIVEDGEDIDDNNSTKNGHIAMFGEFVRSLKEGDRIALVRF